MTTLRKTYGAEVKALPDDGGQTGRFSALVSVFGNVDLQGDRVVPGAFTKSLEMWRASGDPIPVIFSHDWSPFGIIGSADPHDVMETERGLEMTGTLDVATNPQAAQVHSLMKRRIVKEFSFGYNVVKEKMAKDSANDLIEVGLIEAGPTLKGANPATELVGVKTPIEEVAAIDTTSGSKAGRVISSKNESKLRGAISAIEEVLASLGEAPTSETSDTFTEAKATDNGAAHTPPASDELIRFRALIADLES